MNKLEINCDKIEDRIKEQNLAKKRGWSGGCYGKDKDGYVVSFYKFKKIRSKAK